MPSHPAESLQAYRLIQQSFCGNAYSSFNDAWPAGVHIARQKPALMLCFATPYGTEPNTQSKDALIDIGEPAHSLTAQCAACRGVVKSKLALVAAFKQLNCWAAFGS